MPSPVQPKLQALYAIAKHLLDKFPEGGAGGGQAYLQVYHEAVQLPEGARALDELRAARNPTETDGAHIKRVSAAAQKYAKEIDAMRERVDRIVRKGQAEIEARIKATAQLVPDAYAAELRAVWRGMSSKERADLVSRLIEEKRGAELAAIVKAPGALTGMPDDQRRNYETAYLNKHARPELIDHAALKDALEAATVAAQTAREVADAYNDPAKLAEIAKAEAAAAAAAKKFDATVSG
jgi:hypothetical protein